MKTEAADVERIRAFCHDVEQLLVARLGASHPLTVMYVEHLAELDQRLDAQLERARGTAGVVGLPRAPRAAPQPGPDC